MNFRRRSAPLPRRVFLRRAGALLAGAPLVRALGPAAAVGRLNSGAVYLERYCQTMGSIASITLYGADRTLCEDAVEAAFAEMRRMDRMLTSFDPGSAVNTLNRSAGKAIVPVPPELLGALESSRMFFEATGGGFDITIRPLLELYGFLRRDLAGAGPAPDDRTIARALDSVGIGHLVVDRESSSAGLTLAGAMIDLGGIGVGLALDRAGDALRRRGVEAALLNHSGDILAIGTPPGEEGWSIGIQDPADPRGTVATFTMKDRSISTSGNYENFVELEGGRVGHILDPLTGRSPSQYLSVSVMAGTSLAADALSTGFFAGGVGIRRNVRAGCGPRLPEGTGKISAFVVHGGERPGTEFVADAGG